MTTPKMIAQRASLCLYGEGFKLSPENAMMAITNADIAASLGRLADLLEIEGENPFRIHAYRHAIQLLQHLERPVAGMIEAGEPLTTLPGIGKALDAKIREIVATGHLTALEREERNMPATLRELLAIPGLGPRRVHAIFERLHVRTVDELAAAAKAGKLRTLPGFGEKRETALKDYLCARSPAADANGSPLLEPLLGALRHGGGSGAGR